MAVDKQWIINVLEEMIEELGEGGMDVSYGGENYGTAQAKAADVIALMRIDRVTREG